MLYRRVLLTVALSAVLFAPSAARGDDVADLKATYEQVVVAINKGDLDALTAQWHDQIVAFGPTSPFPVAGKAAYRQIWQTNFAENKRFTLTPINLQYQVIGNTGVIWGHLAVALKPKGGPARTQFLRFTGTYVKSDGKWLSAATHVSLIPPGN